MPTPHWTETVKGRVAHYLQNPFCAAVLVHTVHHDTLGTLPSQVLNFAHAGTGPNTPSAWIRGINAKHAAGKLPYRVTVERIALPVRT